MGKLDFGQSDNGLGGVSRTCIVPYSYTHFFRNIVAGNFSGARTVSPKINHLFGWVVLGLRTKNPWATGSTREKCNMYAQTDGKWLESHSIIIT